MRCGRSTLDLTFGLSPYSSYSYICYAVTLAGMGEYAKSYDFANLALAANEKSRNRLLAAKLFLTTVCFYTSIAHTAMPFSIMMMRRGLAFRPAT